MGGYWEALRGGDGGHWGAMGGSGARSGAVLLQSGVCSAGARHWVVLVRSAGRHRAVLVRGTGWCCAAPGSSGAAQRLRPRPLRSPPLPAGGRGSPPPVGASYWSPRQPISGGARGIRSGEARAHGGMNGAGRRGAAGRLCAALRGGREE